MVGTAAALLISGILAALGGVAGTVTTNLVNAQMTRETNQVNADLQREINQANIDASKEFAQNQVQWKAQDLQAAGFNPVLAASGALGGGSVSPSTAYAPQMKAPQYDFSGISTALNAMNNVMLTMALMNNRSEIAQNHDATAIANTQARNATSTANNQARNDVLNKLYQRKAGQFADDSKFVHSAKQVDMGRKMAEDSGEWEALLKQLKKMPYKYNWKK